MTDSSAPTHSPLDASTRLAVVRNRLALDRTLMAWIRTSISLITFGYAIYKVIDIVRPDSVSRPQRIGHREFGLTMISIGLVSLVLGTYEHRRESLQLHADFPAARGRSRSVRVLSGLVAALGLLALLTMILRS
jgi:putative membrane protein